MRVRDKKEFKDKTGSWTRCVGTRATSVLDSSSYKVVLAYSTFVIVVVVGFVLCVYVCVFCFLGSLLGYNKVTSADFEREQKAGRPGISKQRK